MPKIRVALRVRPLSQREIDENHPVVVSVENNSAVIADIRVPERPSADSRPRYRQFDFDHTFWFSTPSGYVGNGGQCRYSGPPSSASQFEVYKEMGPFLEKATLAGYNACLLAYGQSGSGKTHTMIGSREDPGIIPRLCRSLWDKLRETYPPQPNGQPGFRMEVSFLEIYREKVRDLLNPERALKLREHPQLGPHVQGLTRLEVTGEISLLDLLWEGECRRASGNTISNRRSSRSHAIWTLYLTVFTPSPSNDGNSDSQSGFDRVADGASYKRGTCKGRRHSSRDDLTSDGDTAKKIITNQVHLVDLAGSEKADCTTAKSLLAEGADINRSLVALGNVISALAERAQYVPYRDSALTWLLKDSIGGNASTSIIITASPSSHCHAQTLNSLRFAQRARLVENTPKINLAPASSNHYGPYGYLSVMSAMELKKDISRLAKIIKSAQTNGGLLRGLAPRTGWTRLIHAIEGINQAEKEQVRLQRERAGSEDTSASSSQGAQSSSSPGGAATSSSSSATLTAAKSLNDVMVQADMEKRHPLLNRLRRRQSRQSESALNTSSPTKIRGTEVFIPTSNSYKCLTWQQEETHPVPKPASSTSSLISSEDLEDNSGTPTKSSSHPQIHHLKYFLEVHYPVTHNLDHAARISEKIHGNIVDENYQQKTELIPVKVESAMMEPISPLVQEQAPTLMYPHHLEEVFSEEVELEPVENEEATPSKSPVLVAHTAKESKEYLFPTKCKEFASAITNLEISPLESSDEHEFDEPEETPLAHPGLFRAVHPETSKRLQRTLSSDHSFTFDDTCYFTGVESTLSQVPCMVISSSSSYESINMPDTVRPVNLIREFSTTNDITEDYAENFTVDNEVFREDYEPPVANVYMVPGQPMETAEPIEILVAEPLDNTPYFNPINGVSDSKFRNYFAKELHQMERMGKQIKTLLQMTQRYNVVKPYLDEISNLQNSDHSRPDPSLDAHIESCSGWNVDIELDKVHQEIKQLNKVLKTGLGTEGMVELNVNSVIPKIEKQMISSTSTVHNDAGVTSDEGSSLDYQASFAHTRHIPLLSSKANSIKSNRALFHLNSSPPPHSTLAKSSVSQPVFSSSSSSNNTSIGSGTTTTARGNIHFRPNIFSTPKQRKMGTSTYWNGRNDLEGGSSSMSLFPPKSTKSMEVFYRNPESKHAPTSLPYCNSNSNMSSISSNATVSVNMDEPHKGPAGRLPVNFSFSEPTNFGGLCGSRGLMRVSESSTNFNPFQYNHHHSHRHSPPQMGNSFNPDEIRSHRHLYENRLSSEPTKAERELWSGLHESSEYNDFSMPYQYHHSGRSATADSLDLCSCGDTNSAGSTGAPHSSLEKSSSRSQFSGFGGSTTTDISEQYVMNGNRLSGSTDYPHYRHQDHHHHPEFHNGLYNGHNYVTKGISHANNSQHPSSYKLQFSKMHRNENF